MKQDLTAFCFASPANAQILTVESSAYLPRLRALCPNAQLTAVTRYEELPAWKDFAGLDVRWRVLDYRTEALPFPEESFDLIVAEPCLTETYEPYETVMGLNRLLKQTGVMLTGFRNVRYHAVLDGMRDGRFPSRSGRLWAKADVVQFLHETLFKEIAFTPGAQDEDGGAEASWESRGFEDYHGDLRTEVWLVKASRSSAAVANLKSLYTKKTRAELARILHRIEYGIDIEENRETLRRLMERESIFPEYLADFVQSVCAHPARVLTVLQRDPGNSPDAR